MSTPTHTPTNNPPRATGSREIFRGLMRIARGASAAFILTAAVARSQTVSTAPPYLNGVYSMLPERAAVAGKRNSGSPEDISLLPDASQRARAANLKEDPAKMCQPIGPFRMMAREANKIEIVNTGALVAILFEDEAHGLMRKIGINLEHEKSNDPDIAFTWMGDSVGHWDGVTLVVDSVGFNDRTWLNKNGAPHSEALHLVERLRPFDNGKYLEYKVTADDPKVLTKPYTYVRYFEKVKTEITEDICEYQD